MGNFQKKITLIIYHNLSNKCKTALFISSKLAFKAACLGKKTRERYF